MTGPLWQWITILTGPLAYATGPGPFVSMGLVLLGTGVALLGVVIGWTIYLMHRPARMTGARALVRLGRLSPAELALAFEPMDFVIPDTARPGGKLRLCGWWLPHPDGGGVDRTCVFVHGYGDSRIGALAWARPWQAMGFHLLLIDLRAHGDSEGRLAGGGVWEREDLHHVLNELRVQRPDQARVLVLFGVSFGALVASATAAGREDVSALVLESPIAGWREVTRRYGFLLGVPLDALHRLRMRLAEGWLGVRFEEVRTARSLASLACPTLLILPQNDALVSSAEAQEMVRALETSPSASQGVARVWQPVAAHNLSYAADPEAWTAQVRAAVETVAWRPRGE